MNNTSQVKNVFKNGENPSKDQFTKLWIEMVNRIEKNKTLHLAKQ